MNYDPPRAFLIDIPEWQKLAGCLEADPEIFFPEATGSSKTKATTYVKARAVCDVCPVKAKCLEWMLEIERREGKQPGMFGGLTWKERRPLLRCRLKTCDQTPDWKNSKIYCKNHSASDQPGYGLKPTENHTYYKQGVVRNG